MQRVRHPKMGGLEVREQDRVETLDHVAVVSEQPEALFSAYERLGFRLTPLAQHSGAITPGGPVEPWGTGNRCAMFRRGYLELLAIVDPALPCRGFDERVARYEGLHILAFGCRDAQAAASALVERGVNVLGVGRLERPIATPDGEGQAAFSLVRLAPEAAPECHLNIMQHHTPDLLWQSRHLDHPNGAQSLESVLMCVEDPGEVAARYARLLGHEAVKRGRRLRFELPRGGFELISPENLTEETGLTPPTVPFVASFSVGCTSLDAAAAVLDANQIAYSARADGLHVDSLAGRGATCHFTKL